MWQGGFPQGCVYKEPKRKNNSWTVRFIKEHNKKRDVVKRYFATEQEAIAWQKLYSDEMGYTQNQWRELDGCIEMQIDRNNPNITVIFDVEDKDRIMQYSWHTMHVNNHELIYARARYFDEHHNRVTILMHQLVTNFKWEKVDHIDHDTLDNRKINLRDGSGCTNQRNLKRPKNAVKTEGIIVDEKDSCYVVTWTENRKQKRQVFEFASQSEKDLVYLKALTMRDEMYKQLGYTEYHLMPVDEIETRIQKKRKMLYDTYSPI